ncbi:MAG TPA: 3-methyl-2-oxobutanoate hydroxymethyltransferase, partial [Gemmatimonadaceae bacterium]|nr:3-methyl-2-oxobutanoate hydroxymethyltransferase [Gemmatimonadaceae bacterium]
MTDTPVATRRLTTSGIRAMKGRAEAIVMVTAYDFATAQAAEQAGVDIILVGDSLGMVVQGAGNTLPVTMDEMIYHCRSVARGT